MEKRKHHVSSHLSNNTIPELARPVHLHNFKLTLSIEKLPHVIRFRKKVHLLTTLISSEGKKKWKKCNRLRRSEKNVKSTYLSTVKTVRGANVIMDVLNKCVLHDPSFAVLKEPRDEKAHKCPFWRSIRFL